MTDTFQALHYYALLDCAAHEGAFAELRARFPDVEWRSLFEDTPEADLVAASPILIACDPHAGNEDLRTWLLELERDAPSVSWIESPVGLATLGAMLSGRMPCSINDGQEAVLRFWDPRILLGLPSALDAEQRRHFFFPVLAWTAWEPRRGQYYTITAPPGAAPVSRYAVTPMALTGAQREQLMYYDKERLYEAIIEQWEATCPDAIADIDAVMLREIAIAAVARCAGYGLHAARDQILFAGLMMSVSPSFDDHPAVQRALRDQTISADVRLDHLIESLPERAWEQIAQEKRYDALFEHSPLAVAGAA